VKRGGGGPRPPATPPPQQSQNSRSYRPDSFTDEVSFE